MGQDIMISQWLTVSKGFLNSLLLHKVFFSHSRLVVCTICLVPCFWCLLSCTVIGFMLHNSVFNFPFGGMIPKFVNIRLKSVDHRLPNVRKYVLTSFSCDDIVLLWRNESLRLPSSVYSNNVYLVCNVSYFIISFIKFCS